MTANPSGALSFTSSAAIVCQRMFGMYVSATRSVFTGGGMVEVLVDDLASNVLATMVSPSTPIQ